MKICSKSFFAAFSISIIAFALSGCGGGGGGGGAASNSTVGTVTGYLYTRSSARSAGAAPAGYMPLASASVSCAGSNATTNADGYYEVKNVPAGQRSCSATKVG